MSYSVVRPSWGLFAVTKTTWHLSRTCNGSQGRKVQNDSIKEIKDKNKTLVDAMEISNSMNKYFSTIGSNLATNLERPSVSFEHYIQPSKCTFKLQETNPETVQNLLSNLKTSKSTGLDNISCRLLKEAASIVAKSLCNIFNKSIASGKFPTEWKQSKVITIHKNGDKISK